MHIAHTVLAFGTFDLLHPGHEFFLRFAREQGVRLTVVIARDQTVERLKGRAPCDPEAQRKEAVRSLGIADEVLLGESDDHLRWIRERRPDLIVLGYDQTHFTDRLRGDLDALGLRDTRIVRAPSHDPERWKSSKLREGIRISRSPEETMSVAAQMAARAKRGDVYLLTGELGAGKTAFVRGFLEALGVETAVTSPTYVYETRHVSRIGPAYHLDLYRIEHPEKLHALGIGERLFDDQALMFIEWPAILERHWPIPDNRRLVRIIIRRKEGTEREIRIRTASD